MNIIHFGIIGWCFMVCILFLVVEIRRMGSGPSVMWLSERDPLPNALLDELFWGWLAKYPTRLDDLWEKLDDTPYTKQEMNSLERFPDFESDELMINISKKHPVPPAPTKLRALRLARRYGYPDHWKARQRPELFILGPPKSGTTFLHGCLAWSMWGNKTRMLYPPASYRWPINRGEGGEPLYEDTAEQAWYKRWNRTGYRRWDVSKELWIYPYYGRDGGSQFTHLTLQRFPPVEVASKNYILTDSTPDHIMIPEVAQALKLDMRRAPFDPKFVVLSRDVVDRGFSHFRLFSVDLRKHFGWEPETIMVYSDKLNEQMKYLESVPICYKMLYQPRQVLNDLKLVAEALTKCIYHPRHPKRESLYLPWGFTALGLRYYLSKFPAQSFFFLRNQDLRKMNMSNIQNFFSEVVPGLTPNQPTCMNASDWYLGNCTGPILAKKSELFCGRDSPDSKLQSWSHRNISYVKGSEKSLAKYRKIGERWDSLLEKLVISIKRKFYVPPK